MRNIILVAALPLIVAGTASACPLQTQAARAPVVVADNSPTSTPAPAGGDARATDTTAFPNSPNGSPATTDKGQPVVTDKAACSGTGPTATCGDSPKASSKADTSDVKMTTPTTVDGTAPKN